ncbi:MAG: hypothetical protein GF417_10275, partial [Candidatus Latescibacteria bacterium]|nr:hypothetical protein [Candidatus Latescibacterota bacterium]
MKGKEMKIKSFVIMSVLLVAVAADVCAQDLEADFRLRFYNDKFLNTRDNRGAETYIRHLARIRAKWFVNPNASFYNEVITFTETNPLTPVRGIAGTGKMTYGISQVFGQLMYPDVLFFDV